MKEQHWDIYYRTLGMQETNATGWLRSQIVAESVDEAITQLVVMKNNVFAVRAYPRASCGVAQIEWVPEIAMRHEPHTVSEDTET